MRRLSVLLFLSVTACARLDWQGTQSLTRDVPLPVDSLLVTAARALEAHGYHTRIVNGEAVVTLPKAVPGFERDVSTAAGPERLWVVQVMAATNRTRAGTKLTVAGFLIPHDSGAVVQRTIPITAADPELFKQLEVVGNWIVDALGKQP